MLTLFSQASPSTVWGAVMLAIYLVGGHVRTRLTQPVVRAVVGLLLSSRGWLLWTMGTSGGDVFYVYFSPFFVQNQLVRASNVAFDYESLKLQATPRVDALFTVKLRIYGYN